VKETDDDSGVVLTHEPKQQNQKTISEASGPKLSLSSSSAKPPQKSAAITSLATSDQQAFTDDVDAFMKPFMDLDNQAKLFEQMQKEKDEQ